VVDGDNTSYEIASIVSDTEITLTAPYPSTKSGVGYSITNDFTPTQNLPLIDSGDRNTAPIIKKSLQKIDSKLQSNSLWEANYKIDANGNPYVLDSTGVSKFHVWWEPDMEILYKLCFEHDVYRSHGSKWWFGKY